MSKATDAILQRRSVTRRVVYSTDLWMFWSEWKGMWQCRYYSDDNETFSFYIDAEDIDYMLKSLKPDRLRIQPASGEKYPEGWGPTETEAEAS